MAGDPAEAAAALLLPPGVAHDALAQNRSVRESATTPALRRYAGVVYDGLGYEGLPERVQRVAGRDVLIFSGLWGVLRGNEPVPDYRVPAKAVLPGIGAAARFWRKVLDRELPAMLGRGLIVDLRSSDYAAMWRPGPALAGRIVVARLLSPLPRGGLGVISYNSKYAKGRLAAALLSQVADGGSVRSADDVARTWLALGGEVDRADSGRLDLVTRSAPGTRS